MPIPFLAAESAGLLANLLNHSVVLRIFARYWRYFLEGARGTVIIALITVLLGSILGCGVALLRLSNVKPLVWFSKAYISVIRGTPLLVQLYIVYLNVERVITFPNATVLWLDFRRTMPCIIALVINSAAYVAEIVRAGIQAVDIGQTEAARSVGMTGRQAMGLIILPQAVKNILPAIGNEFVTMIKETSIIQYLGVPDLMFKQGIVTGFTYKPLPSYYIAAAIYYILNLVMSHGVNTFERRLQASDRN
ncbi:MAG: amino acid ABC transporter permease [Clostridiales bacterium]|nr:amino acid ABC transporter permease [Clostridiales bacterium]